LERLREVGGLDGVAAAIANKGFPAPGALAAVAAAAELAGALTLAAGFRSRRAAVGLIAYTAIVTLAFHDFWAQSGAASAQAQIIHFLKNAGIIGGFLLVAGAGAGRLSLDAAREAGSGRLPRTGGVSTVVRKP
jgi:putative oxidoreductase